MDTDYITLDSSEAAELQRTEFEARGDAGHNAADSVQWLQSLVLLPDAYAEVLRCIWEEGSCDWLGNLVCLVACCTAVALFFLLVWSVLCTAIYFFMPCDQPLHLYVFVDGTLSGAFFFIFKVPRNGALTLLWHVMELTVIFWGVYMVSAAETCNATNPQLFNSLKRYICTDCALAVLMKTALLVFYFFPSRVNDILTSLSQCRDSEAVRKLPYVPITAEELVDSSDGQVKDCPICAANLGTGGDVVRTPCSHYFHIDCLTMWCKRHLNCPLCRAAIGGVDRCG
eukprot:NODE_12394_length_1227_cov_5.952727.p1 GENE.NODE_12394_length_1227_cov_5.952727~~NODE_12394_length_1227_cov_5.952727.p1  ORF type:complete len:284 (+),score=35.37 NODE_12394_length_1227_cov_5.952727:44-895(+)